MIKCLTQTDTFWLAGSNSFYHFHFHPLCWQPESTNLFSIPLFFGKLMQIITFGMFLLFDMKKCHTAAFRHLATGRFLFGVGTFIAFVFIQREGVVPLSTGKWHMAALSGYCKKKKMPDIQSNKYFNWLKPKKYRGIIYNKTLIG